METCNAVSIARDAFSAVITVMIGAYLWSRKTRTKESPYFLWFCVLNLYHLDRGSDHLVRLA